MKSIAERPLAILSAPGSRGDVNPLVAIGSELKHNGFDVVISLAENYAHVAEAAGLQVEVLFSRAEFDALLGDPSVWKPFSRARAVLRDAVGKFLEPHLDVIKRHHRPQRTVLVAHPLDFASRIYRDCDPATPLVSVQLSPAIVRDPKHPPRLSPWWFEPRRPAWLVSAGYAFADYAVADRFLSPSVNATRKRLGLPRVSRIMDRWWLSPDLVLGMYPAWFGDARPSCDGKWMACGFPISTAHASESNAEPTAQSAGPQSPGLDEIAGQLEQPKASLSDSQNLREAVFVTPGTAHRHAHDLLLNTMMACKLIGRSCIVATSYPEQVPASLPSHVTSIGYVRLDPLLRTCAAIVHHGGIGTTSTALATGCPQLVCPLAFDQFHNADRVHELGVGIKCRGNVWKHSKNSVHEMANSLRCLVEDAVTRHRCDDYATREGSFRGAVVAAAAVGQLLSERTGYRPAVDN